MIPIISSRERRKPLILLRLLRLTGMKTRSKLGFWQVNETLEGAEGVLPYSNVLFAGVAELWVDLIQMGTALDIEQRVSV